MADDRNVLKLAASGKPDKLAADVAELRSLLPARIEYQKVMAKLQREAYDAYLAEGFTPAQALELVKELKP
jgi:hypothetical protein